MSFKSSVGTSIAVMLMVLGGGAIAQASSDAAIAARTQAAGAPPLYCASVGAARIYCTWHERRVRHVVCEFGPGGDAGRCRDFLDNESMNAFPNSRGKTRRGRRIAEADASKARLQASAQAELDAASTLDAVIELVGAGPLWCMEGETLLCGWKSVRRTPGYITLARAQNAPGKKIALICEFNADGSSRKPGSCTTEAASAPRKPSSH